MPASKLFRRIRNAFWGCYWSLYSILIAVATKLLRLMWPVATSENGETRRPSDAEETRYWLWNMREKHGFSLREIASSTGLSSFEIHSMIEQHCGFTEYDSSSTSDKNLSVLPYPGGRHPRRGFQDGALFPQRETKVSLFDLMDSGSYAVVDIPEAIFSSLGLLFLAHTHVPTRWSFRGVHLEALEWVRHRSGSLSIRRKLPNGIEFDVCVTPGENFAIFRFHLSNRGLERLSRLRVQNCVLLGRLRGFDAQSNCNKIFQAPYVACRSRQGDRWVVVHSRPCWRVWANPFCPCIHSDAQLSDCGPGETSTMILRVGFYSGKNIYQEFQRLDAAN